MEQIYCHLIGDFLLQNNWMANNKTKSFRVAILHAFLYTLPFLYLTSSLSALFIIFSTHAIIDHLGLAKYFVFGRNWISERQFTWEECSANYGSSASTPPRIAFWVMVITDNTFHLLINYFALK